MNHLQLPPHAHSLLSNCTIRHSISMLVYPMVFTLFIPFYEILVHPFFRKYVPRMKIRVLAGMICMFLSTAGMLIIDAIGHSREPSVCMMFRTPYHSDTLLHLDVSMLYVIPMVILMGLGEMLTFISGEFCPYMVSSHCACTINFLLPNVHTCVTERLMAIKLRCIFSEILIRWCAHQLNF